MFVVSLEHKVKISPVNGLISDRIDGSPYSSSLYRMRSGDAIRTTKRNWNKTVSKSFWNCFVSAKTKRTKTAV